MGIFDRKDDTPKAKPDFSNVQSGSSSTAPAPEPTSTAGTSSSRTYVVVKGDSLSKIAKHEYGDAAKWRRIYEANQDTIKDPDLIYPGQTLKIPGA
jgi:nucleoid-associated protein YgaU